MVRCCDATPGSFAAKLQAEVSFTQSSPRNSVYPLIYTHTCIYIGDTRNLPIWYA
jgi:hypothetical protein